MRNQPIEDASTESFEVDSALLSEIGERLVTTPHVALAELVKNAYDADATEVHVAIKADERGKPTVEVRDNGLGMTRDAVHKYWMRIGTTNKVEDQISPAFGRRKTGEKGIGRFACRRLGRVLELETCARLLGSNGKEQDSYQKTYLRIDWDQFVPGSIVSSIKVSARTENESSGIPGLSLSISSAKEDEWSFRGFGFLKRQLSALCANRGTRRNGYQEDPGFRVFLVAPGLQEANETEDLREQLMNAGWATLTGRISKDGMADCQLVAKGLGKRSIKSSHTFSLLKDVRIRLAIFPIEREWLRDLNVVSQSSVKDICDQWGGVHVRYRGFRVYPYGEAEDDWLGIERDRARRLGRPSSDELFDLAQTLDGVNATRAFLNMLSMKSYLGSIEVGQMQDGLQPKADRMGFIENDTFRELRDFARFAIDWTTVLRDYSVQLKETTQRDALQKKLIEKHGKEVAPDGSTESAVRTLRVAIRKVAEYVPQRHQDDVEFLNDAASYLESTLRLTDRDLLRLRLVASASTLTLLFAHEIKSLTSSFAAIGKELSQLATSQPSQAGKRLANLANQVVESEKSLSELIEMTNSLGILNRDAKPIRLELLDCAERAKSRFKRITERYGIDIDLSGVHEGLQVGPMLEGELLAVLINILSNSIKSVIAAGGQKAIAMQSEAAGKHVRLDLYDNGVGLPPDHFEEAFTPMISDPSGILYDRLEGQLNPEDRLLLGGGTGLGLSIVRGILKSRSGNAEILPPTTGWRFHLRLYLP